MPYGLPWRRRRKELHQFFHPNAVSQYQSLQQREALKFLKKVIEKPDAFLHQVRQYVPSFPEYNTRLPACPPSHLQRGIYPEGISALDGWQPPFARPESSVGWRHGVGAAHDVETNSMAASGRAAHHMQPARLRHHHVSLTARPWSRHSSRDTPPSSRSVGNSQAEGGDGGRACMPVWSSEKEVAALSGEATPG